MVFLFSMLSLEERVNSEVVVIRWCLCDEGIYNKFKYK